MEIGHPVVTNAQSAATEVRESSQQPDSQLKVVRPEERFKPARGLVLLQNGKGRAFRLLDVKRWMRLNRTAYRVEKLDVHATAGTVFAVLDLCEYARTLELPLSLRVDASFAPPDLAPFKQAGVYDVFLCPITPDEPHFQAWLAACRVAELPVRVQIQAPFDSNLDVSTFAERLAAHGVVAVNVALFDSLLSRPSCRDLEHSRRTVAIMNQLVSVLAERGIEANLLRVPFCHVDEVNRKYTLNYRQCFLDHQQYHQQSYELAVHFSRVSPLWMSKSLLMYVARYTNFRDPVDNKLLPWILNTPWLYVRVWAWHKMTRHLRFIPRAPKPVEESAEAHERAITEMREDFARKVSRECAQCRFRRICDCDTAEFHQVLPGLSVRAVSGELVVSPMHFCAEQPKYYDFVDAERLGRPHYIPELVEHALELMNNHPPDRAIGAHEYEIEGQYTLHMPGAVRWYSFTNSEKTSTVLARVQPPFMVSVVFGGGIAEHIGFRFGRHSRIMCPMLTYTHRLMLYVATDGRYVLLRDNIPVTPSEFEGTNYVPLRLGSVLEPRLNVINIDGGIVTQNICLWLGDKTDLGHAPQVKYSMLIVTTRFARRLAATLQNLARQEGFDLSKLEVIVCYVPELDATDDVIDNLKITHPELRVIRSPFPEQNARSKGFMINESLRLASGEWIVLLDSDILLAPDFFKKVEEVEKGAHFIAPDGRKMLTPETTARVLLGEIQPWTVWQELLKESGEYRFRESEGVPIGYCQIVRAECMKQVPYAEYDHFEGADWWFGVTIRHRFGKEVRLSGTPVIHLDHGGSQWYGTSKQC
ncbi:MAG: glycosyltransferase family 2 protein [Candidatus Hydrogenedentes bacterium]|nr:glycosyltransferase family 2 protein [Candidatus Hydrogenedentota bacterium]